MAANHAATTTTATARDGGGDNAAIGRNGSTRCCTTDPSWTPARRSKTVVGATVGRKGRSVDVKAAGWRWCLVVRRWITRARERKGRSEQCLTLPCTCTTLYMYPFSAETRTRRSGTGTAWCEGSKPYGSSRPGLVPFGSLHFLFLSSLLFFVSNHPARPKAHICRNGFHAGGQYYV